MGNHFVIIDARTSKVVVHLPQDPRAPDVSFEVETRIGMHGAEIAFCFHRGTEVEVVGPITKGENHVEDDDDSGPGGSTYLRS